MWLIWPFPSDSLDTFSLGTEEVLMETVLLPRGRTMSQEEVEVLMTQTVQRVSDTLSVSADIAQHLLIHCKWNVDVLIQRYTEDPEQLLFSSGLQVRNPQPPLDPVTHCPVCVNQLAPEDNSPVLCCMHYCCKVRIDSLYSLDGRHWAGRGTLFSSNLLSRSVH